MKPDENLDSDAVEANANSSPTRQRPVVSELSEEAKVKLDVILSLIEPCDRATYGERLREGAKKLGISVRSVQRLVKTYQEEGLAALTSTTRADRANIESVSFGRTSSSRLTSRAIRVVSG
jgi:putative transposase